MSKIASLSANALLSKSRAMYGKRLTAENYAEMMNCRTVSELASYLRTKTGYGEAFADLPAKRITRARLEAVVRRRMLQQWESLCRFQKGIGGSLYIYFILKNDIEFILSAVLYIDSQLLPERLLYIPQYFAEQSELDYLQIARAKTLPELFEGLRGTRYEKTVAPFTSVQQPNYSLLENALYGYLYEQILSAAKKDFKGRQLEEILDLFRLQSDMATIESLYRVKKYFKNSAAAQGCIFTGPLTAFDKKTMDLMLSASDESALSEIVKKTPYGKVFSMESGNAIEEQTGKMGHLREKKCLRYSDNPTAVMLSYVFILRDEVANIVHIAEGIRYGLPPAEIERMLITE